MQQYNVSLLTVSPFANCKYKKTPNKAHFTPSVIPMSRMAASNQSNTGVVDISLPTAIIDEDLYVCVTQNTAE